MTYPTTLESELGSHSSEIVPWAQAFAAETTKIKRKTVAILRLKDADGLFWFDE